MTNLEKYKKVFMDSLSISENELTEKLVYNSIETWDSVGHMGLIAALEEVFEIELDTDDIIDFSSYKKGFGILGKYNIEL